MMPESVNKAESSFIVINNDDISEEKMEPEALPEVTVQAGEQPQDVALSKSAQ